MPLSKTDPTLALHKIHDMIDDDLLSDLQKFLTARGQIKTPIVTSTFAYLLADSLSQMADSQEEVCILSGGFCDYVHQMAHGCFDGKDGDTVVLVVDSGPKTH